MSSKVKKTHVKVEKIDAAWMRNALESRDQTVKNHTYGDLARMLGYESYKDVLDLELRIYLFPSGDAYIGPTY